MRPDQFNFLFHGLILPKYESVGRQKKKKINMNLINIDLGLHTLRVELADHLAKGFFPAILRFTIVLGLIMAEENIEVSAGCSHERLQFGHALPHPLFFFFFWIPNILGRSGPNQIGLACVCGSNGSCFF